jgi:3-oxoacyl-(acyl-carrier-protein) synthase
VRRALIRARGVVTPFGAGEAALWDGLVAGEQRLAADAELGGRIAARVPEAALARARGDRDRTLRLCEEAALQLRESPAFAALPGGDALGVCVGTTQGAIARWTEEQERLATTSAAPLSPPWLLDPAAFTAERLGARGPLANPSMACASGSAALGLAAGWLRRGLCDAAIAGGADALSLFVHAGFDALRALDPVLPRPFDHGRAGLGLGEAAALLLLDGCDGDPPPGAIELAGFGLSSDAHHLTGPDPTGGGLARAIRAALDDAGLGPEAVGFVSAHGTATVFNDLMEAKAIVDALGEHAPHVPVNSIKGAIGHSLAAAGAVEAILCALVLERELIPPTANLRERDPAVALDVVAGAPRQAPGVRVALSTSSGFGGINAALVLRRW